MKLPYRRDLRKPTIVRLLFAPPPAREHLNSSPKEKRWHRECRSLRQPSRCLRLGNHACFFFAAKRAGDVWFRFKFPFQWNSRNVFFMVVVSESLNRQLHNNCCGLGEEKALQSVASSQLQLEELPMHARVVESLVKTFSWWCCLVIIGK